jgi:hyperosmotically inducible protein
MQISNTSTRAALAAVIAIGALSAACSKRDDQMTAGQKLDAAVAEVKSESQEAKVKAEQTQAEASAKLDEMSQEAKAKAEQAGTALGDAAVVAAINAKLAADKDLEASKIEVVAHNGSVVLKGTAPSDAAVLRAVSLAKGTDGVNAVTSELKIQKG